MIRDLEENISSPTKYIFCSCGVRKYSEKWERTRERERERRGRRGRKRRRRRRGGGEWEVHTMNQESEDH